VPTSGMLASTAQEGSERLVGALPTPFLPQEGVLAGSHSPTSGCSRWRPSPSGPRSPRKKRYLRSCRSALMPASSSERFGPATTLRRPAAFLSERPRHCVDGRLGMTGSIEASHALIRRSSSSMASQTGGGPPLSFLNLIELRFLTSWRDSMPLHLMKQQAIIVAMVGSTTSKKTTDPVAILNSVCNEGWELVNGSFVFVEEGQQAVL